MRNLGKLTESSPKILETQYTNWRYGENRLVTADSIKDNELAETKNIVLTEDGLPTGPRWGYEQYGVDTDGNKICLLDRFEDSDGDIHLLIVSNGTLKSSTDDGATWDTISGATYTVDQDLSGVQAYGKYWIVSPDQNLSYFDGTNLNTYTEISAPTGVSAAETGVSSGDYYYYYRVVAINNQGQSLPSAEVSVDIATRIQDFDDDGSDYVTVSWSVVTGATGYEIYRSTISGEGEFLDVVTSGGVTSFIDYGGLIGVTIPTIGLPTENTTSGPLGTDIALYKDSLIVCGANSRLYYSGPADVIGHFNRKDGGGWIDINKDSDDGGLVKVHKFQDVMFVFKDRSIWQFEFTADVAIGIRVKNITTATGCVARKTVQTVENDVFFLSERGVFTIGNEPNFLNQIRTNELSARVRPRITAMNKGNLSNACAGYFDAKYWVFYSEGGANSNDNGIMFDREKGGWTYHDNVPFGHAKKFYGDGVIKYLVGDDTDGKIYDFSENYGSDDGSVIEWLFALRAEDFKKETIYKTSKDFQLKLSGVSGQIQASIITDGVETVKSTSIAAILSDAGMGVDLMGVDLMGVGDDSSVDVTTSSMIRRSLRLKRNLWLNQQLKLNNVEGTESKCTLRAVYQSAKPKSPRKNKSGERI